MSPMKRGRAWDGLPLGLLIFVMSGAGWWILEGSLISGNTGGKEGRWGEGAGRLVTIRGRG